MDFTPWSKDRPTISWKSYLNRCAILILWCCAFISTFFLEFHNRDFGWSRRSHIVSHLVSVRVRSLTANLYDIFRQENRAKNREKAAESQKRRFQKAWFWVPAFIFECSKTKTGGFSAGLIFSTNVVYYQSRVKYPLFFEKLRWSDDKSITPHGPTRY